MMPGVFALAVQLLPALLVHLAIAGGLVAWGRWVARRRATSPSWRVVSWLPAVGLLVAVVGMSLSVRSLAGAFEAIETGASHERAALLARSISEAMNVTAAFAVGSALCYLASAVAFAVGSLLGRPSSA